MKKSIKYLIFTLLIILFVGINIVYADTTAELNFCQYAGTRRALMILGYVILIFKILVPLILIFISIMDIVKPVLSANPGDIVKAIPTILKRIIAGFIVFLVPTIINGIFMLLVDTKSSDMALCEACIFHPKECSVKDNDAYDKDAKNIYK